MSVHIFHSACTGNSLRVTIDSLKELKSWSESPHIGLGTFSAWSEQCPNVNKKWVMCVADHALYLHYDFRQLKKLFEFRDFHHIRNVTRTIPSNLASKMIPGGNTILIDAGSRDTVLQFTTILFLTAPSRLHCLQEILKEDRHTLEGVPQIVEWERMQSVLCMAHNIPHATTNMCAGSIVFCTGKTPNNCEWITSQCLTCELTSIADTSGGSLPAKNPGKFFKKAPLSTQVKDIISPFKAVNATVTGEAISMSFPNYALFRYWLGFKFLYSMPEEHNSTLKVICLSS